MIDRIRELATQAWAAVRREPALALNGVGALVVLISAYVVHLTVDQQGAVNGVAAAAVGILTWRATKDGLSAAIIGVLKAAVVVGLAWHLNISADDQALIYTGASALLGAFIRTQVTAPRAVLPAPDPVDAPAPAPPDGVPSAG